jgi:hypothetical protein
VHEISKIFSRTRFKIQKFKLEPIPKVGQRNANAMSRKIILTFIVLAISATFGIFLHWRFLEMKKSVVPPANTGLSGAPTTPRSASSTMNVKVSPPKQPASPPEKSSTTSLQIMEAEASTIQDELAALTYASGTPSIPSNPLPATIVASSSPDIFFSYPHGTLQIGDEIILGTVKESPGHLIAFPDPDNLKNAVVTSTPGFEDLADGDYDPIHNHIYFITTKTSNSHLEILSIDRKTLAWKPVFTTGIEGSGDYATLKTDGTYVYVATRSTPAYLLKVRISDWTIVASHAFPSLTGFHASAFYKYPNRTEWYITTFSIPTIVFKVNTGDFSYSSATIPDSGDATNDCYFEPIDDRGGMLYVTSEAGFGSDIVNTATMSSTHYDTPGSYGFFSDGADLYSADARDNVIIKYPKFNLEAPVSFLLPGYHKPNQWFTTSDHNFYFTDFLSPSALYQYSVSPALK